MPIGIGKAPKTLPQAAKQLWVGTFNGVLDSCEGSTQECDERAARVAWDNVKKKYRKTRQGKWVRMTTKADVDESIDMQILSDDGLIVRAEFIISKASLSQDGIRRWACTASDTGQDRANESATLTLFQDWIDRIQNNITVPWLPKSPGMPFLGLSHYPDLGGYGEAGVAVKMYIDGDVFKASGVFYNDDSHPLGEPLFEAIRQEKALVKKGEIDNPIRISAAWFDVCHSHGDFIFTRRSLADKCPLCKAGQTDGKRYLRGQIDHFAATRVPMNPRTSIDILTEKSMPTRKDDALSIISDEELVEGLDQRARLTGKSEATEDGDPILIIMSGDFAKRMGQERKKKKMTYASLAQAAGVEVDIIKALEAGEEIEVSQANMRKLGKALDMDEEEMKGFFGKKEEDEDKPKKAKAKAADEEDEEMEEEAAMDDDEEEMDKKKKRRGGMSSQKSGSEVEKGGPDHVIVSGEGMAMRPLGGATTLAAAQDWLDSQKQKAQVASNFDMYMAVMRNIDNSPDIKEMDKARKKAEVTRELADRIDTLKSAVADAYLLSPVEMSDNEDDEDEADFEGLFNVDDVDLEDYYEDEESADITLEGEDTMSDTTPTVRATDELEAIYAEVIADKSLTKAQKAEKIQAAMTSFAEKAQHEIDNVPVTPEQAQADLIAQAVKAAIEPLYQEIDLLKQKSQGLPAAPAPQVTPPQWDDMSFTQEPAPAFQVPGNIANLSTPTPVQKSAAQTGDPHYAGNGLPISPYTNKPSSLRAALARTVQ